MKKGVIPLRAGIILPLCHLFQPGVLPVFLQPKQPRVWIPFKSSSLSLLKVQQNSIIIRDMGRSCQVFIEAKTLRFSGTFDAPDTARDIITRDAKTVP